MQSQSDEYEGTIHQWLQPSTTDDVDADASIPIASAAVQNNETVLTATIENALMNNVIETNPSAVEEDSFHQHDEASSIQILTDENKVQYENSNAMRSMLHD
jgi:hypothetical protein